MDTAEPSTLAKLAREDVLAPAPELPYSPKSTPLVLGSLEDHSTQPAALITLVMVVCWKTTRAYCDQGLPR